MPGNMKAKLREHLARLQSLVALLVMAVAMTFLSDSFLTETNLLNILRQISVNLCLSIGMTLVILSGGIDLSVGSVLAFSGAVAAGLLKSGIPIESLDVLIELNVIGAILAALAVGSGLGFFNGLVITRLRVPPFVATLGMLSIARGLTRLWTRGQPITGLGESFALLGTGTLLGLPVPVWISGGLVALFAVAMRRTRFGRYIYAVGGNERAARLSGLNVRKIQLGVYTIAGLLAAVAGTIHTSRLDSATPDAGVSYELDSIAAVVIGGTSLSGGRGTVLGTVLGCLIIGVLNNALALLQVSPFWQLVVKGGVILAAVAIDNLQSGRE